MVFTGALETIAASQQTRAHLRDAHARLGACVFFVSFAGFWLADELLALGLPSALILAVAMGLGVLTGYLAWRRGRSLLERALAEDRSARTVERERQLAEFLARKTETENGR